MSDNEHPDWDAELEELVKNAEVGADEASTKASGSEEDSAVQGNEVPDKDLAELLSERTADLQRLQAEYVNYKRRVDRDRDLARQRGIESVLADLLPVLDGIDAATAHDELNAGTKMIAEEIEKIATKYGLTAFGEEGDPFDPHIHEALMHMDKPGYPVTAVAQVFQKGYLIGDRVVRPARVGVADADPEAAADGEQESRSSTDDGAEGTQAASE